MCLSAAVAQREVRGHPPARLRDGAGDEVHAGELFQLLKRALTAPEPRIPHAGRELLVISTLPPRVNVRSQIRGRL